MWGSSNGEALGNAEFCFYCNRSQVHSGPVWVEPNKLLSIGWSRDKTVYCTLRLSLLEIGLFWTFNCVVNKNYTYTKTEFFEIELFIGIQIDLALITFIGWCGHQNQEQRVEANRRACLRSYWPNPSTQGRIWHKVNF